MAAKKSVKSQKKSKPDDANDSSKKIRYGIILLIVVSLLVVIVAFVRQLPGGYIETQGGSTCSWRLDGTPHTNRTLFLDCQCPNGNKYECSYVGKPDVDCPPFWRDFFGFFRQIRQAAADENHACDLDRIDWSNVPLCKEYKKFVMLRMGPQTLGNC